MTRKMLRGRLSLMTAGLVLLVLIFLARFHGDKNIEPFVPIITALVILPAAWLTSWFQRRAMFVNALRALWSEAVEVKGLLVRYCESNGGNGGTDYYEAYTKMSDLIDKVRGVYSNIGERNLGKNNQKVGHRPFEPLNDMLKIFKALEPPNKPNKGNSKTLTDSFKVFQDHFLIEFERPEPTEPVLEKGRTRSE